MKKWIVIAYEGTPDAKEPRKEFEIWADEKEDVERAARHEFRLYPIIEILEAEREQENTEQEDA